MSTTHTMDYGLNFSLSNFFSTQAKRKQLQQQYHLATSDWKSSAAPMLSCKPLTSVPQQHFSEVRKPSGEHFFDNTNLFPKIPGGKQMPNLGQYHSNAANNKGNCLDAKLSLSCAPYCDFNMNCHYQNSAVSDRCSAQRPQCKSLLKPSMKTSQTDLSFAGVSSDDTENYKTPCSLVKLVNQLLDEPVSDITVPGCSTQSKSSSDYWSKEDESIGEMAIKLADIALFDENLSKSVVKNLAQPESKGPNICMQVNLITQIKKTSKANPTNENSNPKGNFTRNGNQLYVPSMKNKMKAEDYPQKCPGTILDSRRKRDNPKNTSWSGRRVKPDCTYLRGFEGAAFQKPVYNMKQGSGQINKNSETYRKPKSSAPPKHFGGVRAWMQLQAMEANSDSSLSSNEFPYGCKKSGGRRYAADTFKYNAFFKSNEQADDLFQEMQYAQRSRKSFSSSSKSSNSSSSGGHYKLSECVFCKTNGETAEIYQSHVLKDEQGRTVCKVLQQYVCPLCGATGINAHTVKYCPRNKNPPAVATMTTLKAMRSSTGRKRFGPCSGQMRQVPFRFNRYLLPA